VVCHLGVKLNLFTVGLFVDSVEQRVNFSHSAVDSRWTPVLTVPAPTYDFLYIARVNISNEYDNLEYRIICNWLDFGKEQPGRASPASDVVQPATYCICKLSDKLHACKQPVA